MRAAVLHLLERLDRGDDTLSAADVERLPPGTLERLEPDLLARTTNAERAVCPGCEEGCLVSVQHGHRGPVHFCERREDVNVVPIPTGALYRWRIQPEGFARALTEGVGLNGEPRLVGPSTWRLGALQAGKARPGVYFAPGLAELPSSELHVRLASLTPGRAILLVPDRTPLGVPEDRALVFSLTSLLDVDDEGLFLSAEDLVAPFIEVRPRRAVPVPLPPTTPWEAVTIRVVSNTDLQVLAHGPPIPRSHAEMGMADLRHGEPDAVWGTLLVFARNGGRVRPDSAEKTSDFRHSVNVLQRRLRAALGLSGNPIRPHEPGVGWVTRFHIVDARNNNAGFLGDGD